MLGIKRLIFQEIGQTKTVQTIGLMYLFGILKEK